MQKHIKLASWLAILLWVIPGIGSAACPALLDHSMRKLHSSEDVNLCQAFAGKPLLIVNTASHCGFTPQFTSLEAMHQEYGPRGVGFLGVSSNSFFQAAASEEKAADVCYLNYGVSFTMLAPVPVKGEDAHPLFRSLADASQPPSWNFNKYVVDRDGSVAGHFGANIKPDDPAITDLLEELVN